MPDTRDTLAPEGAPSSHSQPALFFRLLDVPIEEKGDALAAQIAALRGGRNSCKDTIYNLERDIFTVEPESFWQIPHAAFSYWLSDTLRQHLVSLPSFDPAFADVRAGLQSLGADEVFIRAWWEVPAALIGRERRWIGFAKGGESTGWFGDVHLVTDWERDGSRQKEFALKKYNSVTRKIVGMSYYFRPGLTYTAYTNKGFFVRALPADCIFSLAGPGIFVNSNHDLLWCCGVLNSALLEFYLRLITDRRKWEPGYVKQLPIRRSPSAPQVRLEKRVLEAFSISRSIETANEVTHVFTLPGLAIHRDGSLLEGSLRLEEEAEEARRELARIQQEIDEIVFDLYELSEADRDLVRAEMGQPDAASLDDDESADDEEDNGEEPAPPEDLPLRVANLLMWCVGVAFGRWDIRFALNPELLPELPGPFEALPRYAPGALRTGDGGRWTVDGRRWTDDGGQWGGDVSGEGRSSSVDGHPSTVEGYPEGCAKHKVARGRGH